MNKPLRHRLQVATERDRDWLKRLRSEVYRVVFKATWDGWIEEKHRSQFESQMNQRGIYVVEIEGDAAGVNQLLDDSETTRFCADSTVRNDPVRRLCWHRWFSKLAPADSGITTMARSEHCLSPCFVARPLYTFASQP